MITINLLGKSQKGLNLEWEVNEILSAKKGWARWRWEFEVRRFERLPYCISGNRNAEWCATSSGRTRSSRA